MNETKSQILFSKINLFLKKVQNNEINYVIISNFLHPKTKQIIKNPTPIWHGDNEHICLDILEGYKFVTTLYKEENYDIEVLESIYNALKVTDEKIQLIRKGLNELYNSIGEVNDIDISLLEGMVRYDSSRFE